MTEAIGWTASVVLLMTILSQLHRQWTEDNSDGVSTWLYIGQTTASVLFVVYSWLVDNLVFVATNSLMLLSAIAGWVLVFVHRRRRDEQSDDPAVRPSRVLIGTRTPAALERRAD